MQKRKSKGFTLLEIVLVLAIMGSILLLIINYSTQRFAQYRRDRAALQMQTVLNAGLGYYVQNGTWPVTCGTSAILNTTNTTLQTSGFLPNQPLTSPWESSGSYSIDCVANTTTPGNATGNFTITATTPTLEDAQIVAGELPLAVVNTTAPYTVTAQVTVPGQNLNNARSVNYSGVYYSGACVPQPSCPSGMTAEIITVPSAVAGVYDAPTPSNCSSTLVDTAGNTVTSGTCTGVNAKPITNYQAYATGPSASPDSCTTAGDTSCYDVTGSGVRSTLTGNYWRVCLIVGSESGSVNTQIASAPGPTNVTSYGLYWTQSMGQIIVFTRCVPSGGEPTGSSLNVWSP